MIKKTKGGYAVTHCHGKKAGKPIKTFRSKPKALAMHRAIMASKNKKEK